MPTINDVAKLAGVSKVTVSRVINNSPSVREETIKKVNDAIQKLKFRPNMVAKMLVTNRSQTIAYIMVNISDPFHNMVSKGIESVCYKKGYITIACDSYSKNREIEYINMLVDRKIDGAIFHHHDITEKQVSELLEAGVKCVMIDNETDIASASSVNTNNYKGGYMAGDYLISLGHTRIACMHGVMERPVGENIEYEDTYQFNIWKERTKGFLDALQVNGLEPTHMFQGNGLNNCAAKYAEIAVKKLSNCDEQPTAIYCENDIMAVATLSGLQERGIKVPNEIAIIGHDGLDLCRIIHPYITTIDQHRYNIGFHAADLLIEIIEGDDNVHKLILDPELVVGETT